MEWRATNVLKKESRLWDLTVAATLFSIWLNQDESCFNNVLKTHTCSAFSHQRPYLPV